MVSLGERPSKKKDSNSNFTICSLVTSMNQKLPRMSLAILFNLLILSQLAYCSPLLNKNVKRNVDSPPEATSTSSSSSVSELTSSSTSSPLDANNNISSTDSSTSVQSETSTTTTTTSTKNLNELDTSTANSSNEDAEDPIELSTQQPDITAPASNVASTSLQDTDSSLKSTTTKSTSLTSSMIPLTDSSPTAMPSTESPSSLVTKTGESSTIVKVAPVETTTPIPIVAEPIGSTQTPSSVLDVTVGTMKSETVAVPTNLTPQVTSGSSINTQRQDDVTQATTATSTIVTSSNTDPAPVSKPQLIDSARTSRTYAQSDPPPQPSMQLQSTPTAVVPMSAGPTTTTIESVTTTIKPLISPLPSLKFTLTAGKYWRFTISPTTLQTINNKDMLRLYRNETSLKSIDEENDWITYNHTSSQLSGWPSLSKNIGSHDFVLAATTDKGDLPKPELIIKVTVAELEKPLVLNHEFALSHLNRQKSQYPVSLHQLVNILDKIATDGGSSSGKSVSMRLSDILLHHWTLSSSGGSSELAITWSNITLHQQQDCPVEMLKTSLKRFTDISTMKQRDNSNTYSISLDPTTRQSLAEENPQMELNLLGSCQSVAIIPNPGTQVTVSSLPATDRTNDQPVEEKIVSSKIPLLNDAPPSTPRTDIDNTSKSNNTDMMTPIIDLPKVSPSDNSEKNSTLPAPPSDPSKDASNSTITKVPTISEVGNSTHDGDFMRLIEETTDYLGPVALTAIVIVGVLLFLCAVITYIVTCIKRKNSQKFRVRNRFDFRYESERRAFLKKGSKPVILESDKRNISIGGTPQHLAKATGDTINNPRRLGTVNTPINDSELSTPLKNLGPPTIDERNQDVDNPITTSDLCKTSFSNSRYS